MPQHPRLNGALNTELERLRDLRRKLCCYVNSDRFCDCKRIVDPATFRPYQNELAGKITGEHTGCAEVRLAIALLEGAIEATSIETKCAEAPKNGNAVGHFGNCVDCGSPFGDPSARFPWHKEKSRGGGLEEVCSTCNEKRVRSMGGKRKGGKSNGK